jgi:hypothetical protein
MNEKSHLLATHLSARVSGLRLGRTASERLARASEATDFYQDLEFVDVNFGRDDPHREEPGKLNDQAHHVVDQRTLTAFNHFIDIKKGPGRFDDYDGYSYYRGSAQGEQFQPASNLVSRWEYIFASLTGFKVDEGIQYWLNDEYVHAPGRKWYRNCSPSLERYSFPQDLGHYPGKRAELAARFPLTERQGQKGRGVPYSVFMPLDNLARYWWGRWQRRPDRIELLGPVLHAVQDASIPHHAAGYNGNWHVDYEHALNRVASRLSQNSRAQAEARRLLGRWTWQDPHPPRRRLEPADRERRPAHNWPIQQLVTWLALHAYHEYAETYQHFRNGWTQNLASMERLFVLAVALGALVMKKTRRRTR